MSFPKLTNEELFKIRFILQKDTPDARAGTIYGRHENRYYPVVGGFVRVDAAGYDANDVISNYEWFLREITLDERGAFDLLRRLGYDILLSNYSYYSPDYAIFDKTLPPEQRKLAVMFDSHAEFGAWSAGQNLNSTKP